MPEQQTLLPRSDLESWYSVCYDVPLEDRISATSSLISSIFAVEESHVEYIRDPSTGMADKAVIDARAFHRLQFLAVHGILRCFPDSVSPEDVLKSLSVVSDATRIPENTKEISTFPNNSIMKADQGLANVLVSGIQFAVDHVPFLIGTDPSVCDFALTKDMISNNNGIDGVHCTFQRKEGCWMIQNVSISGSVMVDGCSVANNAVVEIRTGSQVIIGDGAVSFTFFPNFS
jgi:hypothetical protein